MDEKDPRTVTWADVGRKIFGFLCGMRFSLLLLGVILAACVAGSVIPQGRAESVYIAAYGSVGSRLIHALRLDHVFTCGWFVVLAVLLCLNLLLCSILRFPQLARRWRTGYTLERRLQKQDASFSLPLPENADLAKLGLGRAAVQDGCRYAVRGRIGLWGSWLCHLGMLLVIVGFALGQMLAQEWVVYGIPGSTQPIGDTGYQLAIDDFRVELREDYTVEQYTAALTVTGADGQAVSGEASVNHPLSAFGMALYQDSTGWANYVDIAYDGELMKQDLLCAGEYTAPDQLPTLLFLLNKFYPDFVRTADGSLYTATPVCNNPYSLYSIYYQNQLLAMNVVPMGEAVTVDHFSFTLHDPVQYTLIVIKTDPTAWFVGLASLLMAVGILLAFYCRPQEVWTDGKTLWARAEKAPDLLREQLEAALKSKKEVE